MGCWSKSEYPGKLGSRRGKCHFSYKGMLMYRVADTPGPQHPAVPILVSLLCANSLHFGEVRRYSSKVRVFSRGYFAALRRIQVRIWQGHFDLA